MNVNVFSDATRRLRLHESLRAAIEAISSELSLPPLLARIVRHACELLEVPSGSLGLYDETSEAIVMKATHGPGNDKSETRIAPGSSLAGEVLRTRQPVLREHAALGIPMLRADQLIGFLGAWAPPSRPFDEQDVETLTLYARHAAIAIENARRYEREHRQTERLELIARTGQIVTAGLGLPALLQRAATAIHDLLGYPSVAVAVLDPAAMDTLVIQAIGGEYGTVVPGEYRQHLEAGIAGAAVRERRRQLVNDVASDPRHVPTPGLPGIRAEIAVPILLGGEALGVLNVESRAVFSEEDAASLQIVADYLAVAAHNARLFEGAQHAAVVEERLRLSRDLHDSMTQLLFSASLLAQSLGRTWKRDPPEGVRQTDRLVKLVQAALGEMREVVAALHPEPIGAPQSGVASRIGEEGLAAAIRRHAAEISGEGLLVEVDASRYERHASHVEKALYRVAQEALNNVARHAHATRAEVILSSGARGIHLTVRDYGRGFRPEHFSTRTRLNRVCGMGLANMRDRMAGLGGWLRIRSRPGEGATVRAFLP